MENSGIAAPSQVSAAQQGTGSERTVEINWHTAFAGDEALRVYEIMRDGKVVGKLDYSPQTTKKPFTFRDKPGDNGSHEYAVAVVDAGGRNARSEAVRVEGT